MLSEDEEGFDIPVEVLEEVDYDLEIVKSIPCREGSEYLLRGIQRREIKGMCL